MKKICSLIAYVAIIATINIQAMRPGSFDRPARPKMFELIDPLVSEMLGNTQWEAVFAMLNQLDSAFSINEYYSQGGKPLLVIAVADQNFLAVKKLLEQYQANPNIGNFSGVTPLMIAINRGDLQIIELLLRYKANPLAKDKLGRNSFDYAERSQYRDDVLPILEKYQS